MRPVGDVIRANADQLGMTYGEYCAAILSTALGMPEYAQRFAQDGINVEVLRYLADQGLKDIGVLPGHRRIMPGAIGELADPAVTTPPCSRRTNDVRWRCAEPRRL